MSEPYVGQITAVGFTFAPVGYLMCDGSLVNISAYQTLFDLIGTYYGGDGQSTFALPDLRGRAPLHSSNGSAGSGLSSYQLGQTGGTESVTLTSIQVPSHTHNLQASSAAGSTSPSSAYFGAPAGKNLYAASTATSTMGDIVDPVGGSQPHENRQTFQVINYIIAYEGIFPTPT